MIEHLFLFCIIYHHHYYFYIVQQKVEPVELELYVSGFPIETSGAKS